MNLKLGPLPSSAVSKTIGTIVGGEIAASSAASLPRAADLASKLLSQASPTPDLSLEIPRPAKRPTGTRPAEPTPVSAGFELPSFPAGSRALPLRRFVRDHDSSSLSDGRSSVSVTKNLSAAPLFPNSERATAENPPVSVRPADKPAIFTFAGQSSVAMGIAPGVAEYEAPAVAAESATLLDRPAQTSEAIESSETSIGIESSVAVFESWLDSVGPILEAFKPASNTSATHDSDGQEPSVDFAGIEGRDEPDGSAENAGIRQVSNDGLEAAMAAAAVPALDQTVTALADAVSVEQEPVFSSVSQLSANAAGIFDGQHEHDRFEDFEGVEVDSQLDDASLRSGANEWPSAQDILRWSADRHGRSFLLATTEDLKSLKMAADPTRPREWFHMNFPTALVLCVTWLGGAAFLASLGIGMSREDELTQRSIAAVMAAESTGTVPRLDPQSMQRLTEPASWWKLPPVQRWFRAVFVKLREEKGQPLAVTADSMATDVANLDPLLPPARLWKNTAPSPADMESDLTSLSIDILPLIMKADNERRRGNFDKANDADRAALKMASECDKPLHDMEVVYDAEFGTKRFRLPTQNRLIEILKRIVRDPDAARTFEAVMPKDAPIVWLTAAQLMRHAGLSGGDTLAERAAKWPIPENFAADRRLLAELVKAEANAFLGNNDIAIETYGRLVKQIPESEWKRTVWLNLGVLNLQSLKTNEAKMALKKARGEDPDHEIDRHAIATIRGISDMNPETLRSATTVRAN